MALDQFSEANLANSLAQELATRLLVEGYLVYWHEIDALQTPAGWYYTYSATHATLATDVVFAPLLAASRGIVTLARGISTDRRFPVRPTTDGSVDGQDEVPVPWLVLEVGPLENGDLVEIGSRLRYRRRQLYAYGAARTPAEQSWFCDRLAVWFDESTYFAVLDHDSGSLALVGDVEVVGSATDRAHVAVGPEAKRFEFLLDARFEFVA